LRAAALFSKCTFATQVHFTASVCKSALLTCGKSGGFATFRTGLFLHEVHFFATAALFSKSAIATQAHFTVSARKSALLTFGKSGDPAYRISISNLAKRACILMPSMRAGICMYD
jgi:hypothetical protein